VLRSGDDLERFTEQRLGFLVAILSGAHLREGDARRRA